MPRTAAIALLLLLAGACARSYPPPGGERDVTPPRLASTSPEPLAVVPGYAGPAVFFFEERISERGFSEALVIVSPQDSTLRVERGRSQVRVSLDGGWRPDRIYRVTLLPGLRDLFGNARTEPAEIVFSTGPPVPETAIAGIVLDRISGRAAQTAMVSAMRRADSLSYTALSDSGGFFSLRHLPLGVYEMRAFSDQNRNRRRDAAEPVDSGRVVSLGSVADTQAVVFSVLAPDTTPPRVTRVEVVDSLRLRLTFDDYLMPEGPFDGVSGQVLVLPDSTAVATVAGALHPAAWQAARAAAQAALRADTAALRPDTAAAPPSRPGAAARTEQQTPAGPGAPVGPPAPSRDLVIVLDRPLAPGAEFAVTVGGVVNLHGLAGGGSATFETRPATPTPARPDTTGAVRPDTSRAMRPDTSRSMRPRTSSAVRPRTSSAVRPDSSSAVVRPRQEPPGRSRLR